MPVTRADIADLLLAYAEGVEENLRDDHPGETEFPVVEDHQADADRIRAGEQPLHELTREVLLDETGPACMAEDPAAFLQAVQDLLAVSSLPRINAGSIEQRAWVRAWLESWQAEVLGPEPDSPGDQLDDWRAIDDARALLS